VPREPLRATLRALARRRKRQGLRLQVFALSDAAMPRALQRDRARGARRTRRWAGRR
jgi:hypothetical protein